MRFCTSCGAAVDASMRFCGTCGTPLGGPTTKVTKAPQTPPPAAYPPKGYPPGPQPAKAYPTGASTGDRDRMLVRLAIGGAVGALVLVAIFSLGGDDSSPGNVFHAEGFGAIEIGMTEDEVAVAADGVDWEPAFPDEVGGCSYVDFDQFRDLHGLSGDGLHLGYIEVNDYEQVGIEARTLEGVALGDDEERVEEIYDEVEVTTRPYGEEPDHWLIVDLSGGNRYVFGTTDGTIDQIRVGLPGDVEAIEGCL